MASPHDASDEEWQVSSPGAASFHHHRRASRYPIHDACEFEDADALRRLIFVPLSDESDASSDDDSTTTSSSTSEDDLSSNHGEKRTTSGDANSGVAGSANLPSGPDGDLAPAAARDAGAANGGGAADGPVASSSAPSPGARPIADAGSNGPPDGDASAEQAAGNDLAMMTPKSMTENSSDDSTGHADELRELFQNEPTNDNGSSNAPPAFNGAGASSVPLNPQIPVTDKVDNNINGNDNGNDNNKDAVMLEPSNAIANGAPPPSRTPAPAIAARPRTPPPRYRCPYDLDERDDDENTPLHIAVHARRIENVRVLLEAGATPHKKCDGSAPLHLALRLGAIAVHARFAADCAKLLGEHGADVAMRDDSFHTPLYLACVSRLGEATKRLLEDPLARETLNLKADRTGGRALHAAARWDDAGRNDVFGGGMNGARDGGHHPGVVELLLASPRIEVDVRNNYGRTPLHVAASRGNWHAARLLLHAGADPEALDRRGHTPGARAARRGVVIPGDLAAALSDPSSPPRTPRDLIMDPDGRTLILCHELCARHRTCPPIVRGAPGSNDPPPENVRRLGVLINDDDGVLRCGEFGGCRWETEARRAALSDVLRVHEYPYVERTGKLCAATPDHPGAIQTLDADTTVSRWSFEAALRAAGSVCEAVDRVVAGDARNAFCAVRPPGHHAGPRGVVTCPNDPDGSHGFCLLNNVAIGASYARSMYRNDGIRKVAIVDFDVHHGNGTEEIVRHLTPVVEHATIRTPFAVGGLSTSTYKPWLDENDVDEVFFASTHGYGPRDRQLLPGAVQGGWFYPASGKTYKSKSVSSASDMEKPNLSEFLNSQTWTRLGDEYRNNCCKIIDIGLSLPYKEDNYNHGLQRLELRDAYRKSVIPALLEFDPDMIFISAGFDAHRRDTMNFGYVGMIEEDYEWLTEQLVKVANTCCNGRVVSALEGGYKIHGGIVSPFACSVASHVRALVDGGKSREEYDAEEGEWESGFERHMNEEKEKRRQMKADGGRRGRPGASPHQPRVPAGVSHASGDTPVNNGGAMVHADFGDGEEPPQKRTRKHVDYKHLFEQMKKEGF